MNDGVHMLQARKKHKMEIPDETRRDEALSVGQVDKRFSMDSQQNTRPMIQLSKL